MRYLGIDYGTKKIGLALSDAGGQMGFPHSVVKNSPDFFAALGALIEKEKVETVVIGQSLSRQGNANPVQSEIENLMTDITLHYGLPVYVEPEQYTTQAALRIQGRTTETDASAAALILNSFLTRVK